MKKWRALTLQSLFFFSINSVLFLFFLDPLCYTLENWFPALSAGAPRFIPGFCGSVIALSAVCLFRAAGKFWFSGHQGTEQKMVGIVNAWSNKRLGSVFPGVRDSSSEMKKETSIKIATEGSSLDAPAPLTTFKVRKEKLGDKITALQLLVSPFGKADTASVLLEATRYIKFLNEQVTALSTPYMKVSLENSETREENALRSRGLCLVPVSTILKQENRILSEAEVCV